MNKYSQGTGVALALMLIASPVFAQTAGIDSTTDVSVKATGAKIGVKAGAQAKLETRITNAKSHADQEVDRRVNALNDLNTRVQAMERVSAEEKTSIAAIVSSQVSTLTTLKAKIDTDTDIETLKADIKSIAATYRIFLLIIPQGRIEVAADKIKSTSVLVSGFATKLQTRIADAQAKGKDVTSLTSTLSEMNAKLTDASVQADAAVSLVASLSPDNGDAAKKQANDQAIKDARAKIKAGIQDLQAARKDAKTIVDGLKSFHLDANASGGATTDVQ